MNFFTKYDKRYTIELQTTHSHRGNIVVYLDNKKSIEGTDYLLRNIFREKHIIKEITVYHLEEGEVYYYEELAKKINLKIRDIKTLEKIIDKIMGDLLLKEV